MRRQRATRHLRAWGGAADLDIDPLEEPAVYAKALGPEHVVGVIRVARRAAHEVDKRLPHHRVTTRLSAPPAAKVGTDNGGVVRGQRRVHCTHTRRTTPMRTPTTSATRAGRAIWGPGSAAPRRVAPCARTRVSDARAWPLLVIDASKQQHSQSRASEQLPRDDCPSGVQARRSRSCTPRLPPQPVRSKVAAPSGDRAGGCRIQNFIGGACGRLYF